MEWNIEFYQDRQGNKPVKTFLDTLSHETQVKILRYFKLLKEYGILLKEPYTRQVKGKIREVRLRDDTGFIRVFYFSFTGKRIIMLHGFIKKTSKTPAEEIIKAEKRMNDFLKRMV